MRLHRGSKRHIVIRERRTRTALDGTTSAAYDGCTIYLDGVVQPASGRAMAMQWGERMQGIVTCYIEGHEPIKIGSGAWIYTEPVEPNPDYKVIAVRMFSGHTVLDLERV